MIQWSWFYVGFVACLLFVGENALAQQSVKISQSAWLALAPSEREGIQKKHVIELVEQDAFGVIIDNQGVDESTSGTSGGANLGGAIANAAYIDGALKGGSYSAKSQLGSVILGAMIGSTLDSKPIAKYHYRYAVKLGGGNIKYFDEVSGDPFRHPVGVCVSVPSIALVDQQLCLQTASLLKEKYLGETSSKAVAAPLFAPLSLEAKAEHKTDLSIGLSEDHVNCKLGNLAPVRTSAEKCFLIKGSKVK